MFDIADSANISRLNANAGSFESAPVAARGPRKILFVTTEHSEFLQAGGMGEVSAALPKALGKLCDVRLLIPAYRAVLQKRPDIEIVRSLPAVGELPACDIGRISLHGLIIYVALCAELYDRPGSPYADENGVDWPDNEIRFARLSLAAAELASGACGDWTPDILHLNDWPSALTSGYVAWRGCSIPTVLTIHNLAYQGLFDRERMSALNIPSDAFQMDGVEFHGKLSFLKAGLFYASHLTTVSKTYADEITRAEFGCGMHGLLAERARQGRLTGIVNGIDDSWDPASDSRDPAGFDPVRWKAENADLVRDRHGLEQSTGPLFSIISRLVHQKGVDLAIEAADTIVSSGGQIVITGKGDARFEHQVRALAQKHKGQVAARIGFDATEARSMFAGSDFLLMPSRFEPCGLSQMYAQRFGTLPIAHKTGGLADTISDGVTGFLYSNPTAGELILSVQRALRAFRATQRLWLMRRNAMAKQFSWSGSAAHYTRTYALAKVN